MIFTDYDYLASDNPENDYQELFDYAVTIGLYGRGWEGRYGEIPFFSVKLMMFRQKVKDDGIIEVAHRDMELFLKYGKSPKMDILPDLGYVHRMGHFTPIVRAIEKHNKIKYPDCQEKYIANYSEVSCRWKFQENTECYIGFTIRNPQGIGYFISEEGKRRELEIPDKFAEKLYKSTRPMPKKQANKLKNRIKWLDL